METALSISNGLLVVEYEDETLPKKFRKVETITFSSKFSCPESGFTLEEIEPRLFSFNSPYGACEECEGIGHNLNVDPNLVVPDSQKSLQDGAVEPWAKSTSLYYAQTLASIAKHYKISLSDSWKKLSKKNSRCNTYMDQMKKKLNLHMMTTISPTQLRKLLRE